MPENEIWNVAILALKGLRAMHKNKIVHRDIKAANIFLFKNNNNQKNPNGGRGATLELNDLSTQHNNGSMLNVKIGDLNVSKIAKMGLMQTQIGTPYYASPEVWRDQPYDSKCDIWSLGCVIYELAV